MAELRIDSLLNELVDGGEGMSNRAKFRALPVDDGIMRRIKEVRRVAAADASHLLDPAHDAVVHG